MSEHEHLPAGWRMPNGWRFRNMGRCRSCHAIVAWCISRRDTPAPADRDGRPHHATCPNASEWRRAAARADG